jgi:DNA-binding transcriptional MerR regulator
MSSAMVPNVTGDALTVDELARAADLPVRTIREYQTMRLLPPPAKQGRVGLYGPEHRERLALIARLQERGYSLAGIGDLIASFEAGANLSALLGVELGPAALDETPQRLTRAQLFSRLPALADGELLHKALAVGLIHEGGAKHFLVRSPALLALVADALNMSVDAAMMLDLVGAMRDELDALAKLIVGQLIDPMWSGRLEGEGGGVGDVQSILRRGRLLLLQGVVSVLADRLGDALMTAAETAPHGDRLREALDGVRVGAVLDGRGNLHVRSTP